MVKRYTKLIELLKKAKGDRSLNGFALDCSVDAGHLSRILRGKMVNPPSPDILKRIADKAHNGIRYEELIMAAGHLERRFYGTNLKLLRDSRTFEEYSEYLREKGCLHITPQLLQRYEEEQEQPDASILEYIAHAENINTEFFYKVNTEISLQTAKQEGIPTEVSLLFMDKSVKEWLSNPANYPYIEFIYNAYKAGITKELLSKAEISIKISR